MRKIITPQDLQAEIASLVEYIQEYGSNRKPDRQVLASKLRDLADRVAERSPEAVVRSLRITIDDMDTDSDYRRGVALDPRGAKNYMGNLSAHVSEIKKLNPGVARSIGVTLGDMQADLRRRGEIEPKSFGYYIENLRADLLRLVGV